MTHNFNLMY